MLDYVALAVIFFTLILVTVVIVLIGSTPGKIARRRGHPWPAAVSAASWIGLATGVLWPIAFVWAFLPIPKANVASASRSDPAGSSSADKAELERRVVALEAAIEQLQTQRGQETAS